MLKRYTEGIPPDIDKLTVDEINKAIEEEIEKCSKMTEWEDI